MSDDLFTWAASRPEPETETADVVPFPAARRRAYILEKARMMIDVAYREKTTEKARAKGQSYFNRILDGQRKTLLKRGISPEVAEREIATLAGLILQAAREYEARRCGKKSEAEVK